MAHTAEDMVKALHDTTSTFALAGELPIFKEGIADLVARVRALEAQRDTPTAAPR